MGLDWGTKLALKQYLLCLIQICLIQNNQLYLSGACQTFPAQPIKSVSWSLFGSHCQIQFLVLAAARITMVTRAVMIPRDKQAPNGCGQARQHRVLEKEKFGQ